MTMAEVVTGEKDWLVLARLPSFKETIPRRQRIHQVGVTPTYRLLALRMGPLIHDVSQTVTAVPPVGPLVALSQSS